MSWGTKRRNLVLTTLFLFIFIPIGAIAFLVFYNPPTCFDSIQNSDESGIDCGGSCQLICTQEAFEPVVLWERLFKVDEGVYNVLAYIENQNANASVIGARYMFKLYNEQNVPIVEREGVVSILPNSVLPVIETNIQTEKQIPTRVEFDFVSDLVFEKRSSQESYILVKDELIENITTEPRVKAEIQNITLSRIQDIDIVVILYDSFSNVIQTSSTYVPELNSEESKEIVFTWPNPFAQDVARIEVIPIYESN